MNQLVKHPQFGAIQFEMIKKEPWFVAKDICEIIGIQNVPQAMHQLDEDEKLIYVLDRSGQKRELNMVNESGLYALIIRSNKPQAKKFRKWITSEVLPAIRKYGTYSTDPRKMDVLKKRAEKTAIKKMLDEVNKNLSGTDKRIIAKQCHTDEFGVYDVLDGEKEDIHMMTLLYARATGNVKYRGAFYSLDGAELLLNELLSKKLN